MTFSLTWFVAAALKQSFKVERLKKNIWYTNRGRKRRGKNFINGAVGFSKRSRRKRVQWRAYAPPSWPGARNKNGPRQADREGRRKTNANEILTTPVTCHGPSWTTDCAHFFFSTLFSPRFPLSPLTTQSRNRVAVTSTRWRGITGTRHLQESKDSWKSVYTKRY